MKEEKWRIDESDEVRARNRYSNISAFTENRVCLNVPEERCNYINASPIALKSRKDGAIKRYIATQVCDISSYPAQIFNILPHLCWDVGRTRPVAHARCTCPSSILAVKSLILRHK